ncbi:PorV/PorQ family protein [Elusimicrobiota bacterium]
MIKKIYLLAVVVVFTYASAMAVFTADDAGTAGAQFLKIGVDAGAAAMGEAHAAVSDDPNAIYWNPAGLNKADGREVSFTHIAWLESISFEHVAYAHPAGFGTLGISIDYLTAGEIDMYDTYGNDLDDSFKPVDMAVSIGCGREIGGIPAGLTVKYISRKLEDETATAFAADLGVLYELEEKNITLGAALQNLGTKMKFIEEEEPLPMNIKVGASLLAMESEKGRLLVALDCNASVDNTIRINAGAEYRYSMKEDLLVTPRAGYKTGNKGLGGLTGISAGVGFLYRKYGLDYAWVPYADLGQTHRISLSLKF